MSPISQPDRSSDGHGVSGPDPHGQAALILVESLIHVLMEKGVITRIEAIDAVQTALDIKTEIAAANVEPREIASSSLALIRGVHLSLEGMARGIVSGNGDDGSSMGLGDGDPDGRDRDTDGA